MNRCSGNTLMVAIVATAVCQVPRAEARIKLITLPVRERVEIQLDNPQRHAGRGGADRPAGQGGQPGRFLLGQHRRSTQGHRLPVSGPVGRARKLDVKVLSVSYPPNEAALVWQVASSDSGSARVRISYLLGNLTKSFNYRAVASNDEKTLTLSEYMRCRTSPTRSSARPGSGRASAPRFLKPIGINETKEMLIEKFARCRSRRPTPADPAAVRLSRPAAEQAAACPMHYVLKNDKANQLGQAPLQYGKVRIFQEDGNGGTAFLGEDWGKFTPLDDEMRLYWAWPRTSWSSGPSTRTSRSGWPATSTTARSSSSTRSRTSRTSRSRWTSSENLRHMRNEVRGDTGRDVQWELGKETTFEASPTRRRAPSSRWCSTSSCRPGRADGKAEKIVHKLHVIIKNEW